jgi:hypothetical protein
MIMSESLADGIVRQFPNNFSRASTTSIMASLPSSSSSCSYPNVVSGVFTLNDQNREFVKVAETEDI